MIASIFDTLIQTVTEWNFIRQEKYDLSQINLIVYMLGYRISNGIPINNRVVTNKRRDMNNHILKLVLKTGQTIVLYAEDAVVEEFVAHPKFLKMNDSMNDIYVSIEDVAAFEIASNRKEPPKPTENIQGNGNSQTAEASPQQA